MKCLALSLLDTKDGNEMHRNSNIEISASETIADRKLLHITSQRRKLNTHRCSEKQNAGTSPRECGNFGFELIKQLRRDALSIHAKYS